MDQAGQGKSKMKFPARMLQYLDEKQEKRRKEKTWRAAYDSQAGEYIEIKRRSVRPGDRFSSWVIRHTRETLYSPIGGTPLHITFLEGLI